MHKIILLLISISISSMLIISPSVYIFSAGPGGAKPSLKRDFEMGGIMGYGSHFGQEVIHKNFKDLSPKEQQQVIEIYKKQSEESSKNSEAEVSFDLKNIKPIDQKDFRFEVEPSIDTFIVNIKKDMLDTLGITYVKLLYGVFLI